MLEGLDDEEYEVNLYGDKKRQDLLDDYKRIKKAIQSKKQDELEDLLMFENKYYSIVQAMIECAPQLSANFYANFLEPKIFASGFISELTEWNNDKQKIEFVNRLAEEPEVFNDPNMYYKLTSIAATVKNKNADKGLCKRIKETSLYNYKRELFSVYKNKPENLSALIYSTQGNDFGQLYYTFDRWKDGRKEKLLETLKPYLSKIDMEEYRDKEITEIPVDKLFNIEINATLALLASTIKDKEARKNIPDVIKEDPMLTVRTIINDELRKKNEEELYFLNKYVGNDVNLIQVIQSFRICSSDKMKLNMIKKLPEFDTPEYKQLALILASTLEKKKSRESLPEEIKDDSRYKMIDLLNKEIKLTKIDKYTFSKIMRDVILKTLDVHSAENFKQWKDDNAKLSIINKLLVLNKELPEDMHDFLGEFATDIIQSIKDTDVKAKVPEYSENETYTKYFDFIKEFKKLEDELANPIDDNKADKDNDYIIGIDPKLFFGIEIESEGPNSLYLLNEGKIKTEGNKVSPKVWKTETDQTLENGVEVISSILSDKKKDVRSIYLINKALRKLGHSVSKRCGAHVHMSASYLKSSYSFVNLLEIYLNAEEIIYLMSNQEGELPRETTKDVVDFINPRIYDALENNDMKKQDFDGKNKFVKKIEKAQITRNVGLNLYNVNSREKDTIEFRLSNGTLDAKTWVDNIRLFGKLMEVSEKIGEAERKYYFDDVEPTEEEKHLMKLEDKLKDKNLSRDDKSKLLLDLLFDNDEHRKIYESRYNVNSRLSDETDKDNNPLKQTKFNIIDFKAIFNIKNAILSNESINFKETEQEMMENLEEMEQEKKNNRNRDKNKELEEK